LRLLGELVDAHLEILSDVLYFLFIHSLYLLLLYFQLFNLFFQTNNNLLHILTLLPNFPQQHILLHSHLPLLPDHPLLLPDHPLLLPDHPLLLPDHPLPLPDLPHMFLTNFLQFLNNSFYLVRMPVFLDCLLC
jgi:hypothetical protein